ncbi:MAG TPA: molybdenum cofactor guanylyltransferase [Polyangia bacterium]|jgi:molybdopterin-guanine dinucleotide biosynthesis protein A|nr:molybdenum cofactor guanylyltransferase [Polyangia bacterium]
MTTAAAIIAGGRGTRLGGQVKGLITVDGRRIVDRQRDALAAVFAPVVVVAGDPASWRDCGLLVVPDRIADAGPLGGIDAALAHFAALKTDVDAVVCVASDMPFLNDGVLRLLREHQPDAAAVVPRVAGNAEPLLARYALSLSAAVAAHLADDDLAVHRWLAGVTVAWIDEVALRAVDPTLRSFFNVNTPADQEQAQSTGRR